MGFGHRVYKDGDPRAVYLKELCNELAKETGNEDLEVDGRRHRARDLGRKEAAAQSRLALRPAVPLHGPAGRALHAAVRPEPRHRLGAHIIEQLDNNRLIRPRARYIGPERRPWKPVAER